MKPCFFCAVVAVFIAAPSFCRDDAVPKIAKYPGNRTAAVSLTFDDGLSDHVSIAVPALEKLGIRGTFFLLAGFIPNDAEELSKIKPHNYGMIPWPA